MKEKQRELLLQLRSDLVGKMHVQPFTIYTDDVIEALLEAQPKSLEELANVKGFPEGGKRIAGFGGAVIAVFTKCDKIDGIEVSGNRIVTKLKPLEAF